MVNDTSSIYIRYKWNNLSTIFAAAFIGCHGEDGIVLIRQLAIFTRSAGSARFIRRITFGKPASRSCHPGNISTNDDLCSRKMKFGSS
ncbi:hypothetical protein scyTo_0009397 [Scyliorhinus torazame]|uniref:Uncharacterized protein n=1 Tax=Scyliorhinus torazame TaxID=75743 RepID=A0A401NLN6_SCYTO|nr:hypothetical protein [Scyliorhinus torazame]